MRGEKIFITCLLSTPSCWAFSNPYRRQARVSISLHDSLLSSTGSQLIYSDLDNDDLNIDSQHVNNRHAAGDWLHNIASLPNSSVLREIRNPVLSITAWSTAVSIIHKLLSTSTQSSALKIASDMCIGSQVHSFMVSSLGLLLVFRTNSAYQRFMVSWRVQIDRKEGKAKIVMYFHWMNELTLCLSSPNIILSIRRKGGRYGNKYTLFQETSLVYSLHMRKK